MELNGQTNWEQIRAGDKQAFEQVFRTYYHLLCRFANSVMKDPDEAEEVVQNAFYTIWLKKESLDIKVALKSYLYKSVHNDCLNKLKHKKVREAHAQDYKHNMPSGTDDGSKTLQAKELNKRIQTAIAALPQQCGQVFKLSRFEELKYQEIADHLNISVKTVENHMGKALKLLREQLKDYLPSLLWLFIYYPMQS